MRKPIENGTMIQLCEVGTDKPFTFSIEEIIGMGGSCIVYTAVYTDTENNCFPVRLKELYPEWIELSRDGISLYVSDDNADSFAEAMQQFTDGYKKQMQFRELPESMNSIANIQGIYEGNNTRYIAMSCQNAISIDDADLSLYDIFRVIRAVVLQIANFHDNGYLYLDLKPQNIMLYPETPEMVMLFDFDSAVQIDNIEQQHLSCTDSWAAPEMLLKKYNEIGRKADIYGIGAILLYLLFNRPPALSDRRRTASWDNDIENSLLNTEKPEIKRVVTSILSQTLAASPNRRYSSCDELLDVIEPLISEYQKPKPYLKTFLPMGNNFFCGRDTEIKEIHDALIENDILVLHGIGGIGKSELVKHYALSYADNYDAAVFVRFKGNMTDTITMDSNFPIVNCIQSDDENDEEYFERKVKILQEICTPKHLIILDNFDTDECDNLDVLTGMQCKLLITSRVDHSDIFSQYEVGVIDDEYELRNIITYYYKVDLYDKELLSVDNIISAVQGHTMALELISKHMNAMNISPSKMYDTLVEQGITAGNNGKVRGFKDGSLKSKTAYSHIAALFNIFGLTEDMKQILRYAALVGPSPISPSDFCFLIQCTEKMGDVLDNLILLGWIQCYYIDESLIVNLHPLISDVLCEELKPNADECEDFLVIAAGFAEDILDNNADERKNKTMWLKHIAHNIYGNSTAITFFYHNLMEYILVPMEDFRNVEWCSHRIIQILDYLGLQETFKLAYLDAYLHLIKAAKNKGDTALVAAYEQNIAFLKTPDAMMKLAAERCKKADIEERTDEARNAANEWLNIAISVNDYEQAAYAHYQLGLIESDNEEIAHSHFQYSVKYLLKRVNDLEYDTEGLENDLIHAYKLTGYAYRFIDDYDSALLYYRKAIELTKQEHGEKSGKFITLYTEISDVYKDMSDIETQIEYLEKAADLSELVYGRYHEETANSYLNLIDVYFYYDLDDVSTLEKCTEIMVMLIDIYSHIPGENLDDVCYWMRMYARQLCLLDRKAECLETIDNLLALYNEEPDTDFTESLYIAGRCYYYFNEKEKAFAMFNKVVDICKNIGDEKTLEECQNFLAEI